MNIHNKRLIKGALIGANIGIFFILLILLTNGCKDIKTGFCMIHEILVVINYFFLLMFFKELNPVIESFAFFAFPLFQWSIIGLLIGYIKDKLTIEPEEKEDGK